MVDLHGYYFEDLTEGMSASFAKTITEADIVLYAAVSGDNNPIHLNEEFARTTRFKGRIAHGFLSATFLTAVLGTRLPGPGCIYLSQSLNFKSPVRIGETVAAIITVTKLIPGKNRVVLSTRCAVGDRLVIDGEATVLVESRPVA